MITRVGFIGLGKMGGPMARNLLKAGFAVTVYDSAADPVGELVQAGAETATSPYDVALHSEIVWIMVPASQVGNVLSPVTGGVLKGALAGTIIVDGGNCDPDVSRRHAADAAQMGVSFLDAGCSGGPHGAAEGTLAIMVGGDRAAYDGCLPVFEAVGGQIAYMGPSGNGHLAKVVNNMITKMTDFVIAESLTLGLKAGLDVAAMLDVLTTGAARSWILSQAGELFHEEEDHRYQPTFTDTPRPKYGGSGPAHLGRQDGGRAGGACAHGRPRNRAHEVGPVRRPDRGVQDRRAAGIQGTPASTSTPRPARIKGSRREWDAVRRSNPLRGCAPG